jgi:hypothetical protein
MGEKSLFFGIFFRLLTFLGHVLELEPIGFNVTWRNWDL